MNFNWRKFLVSFTLVSQGYPMLRHLNMLRSIYFYSQNDIQLLQNEKLRALLLHAYTNVKYFRTLFDNHDIIQNNEVDLVSFTHLPLLNKDIILSQAINLCSNDHHNCHPFKNSCGRQFPILRNITKKNFSHFKKRNGPLTHSQFLEALIFYQSWVTAFCITQIDYDKIEIKLSHDQEISRFDKHEINQKIVKLMASSCTVYFVSVDEVVPTSSGKYLYTIYNIGD